MPTLSRLEFFWRRLENEDFRISIRLRAEGVNFEFTKRLAIGDVLSVGELLIAEKQHFVVHTRVM